LLQTVLLATAAGPLGFAGASCSSSGTGSSGADGSGTGGGGTAGTPGVDASAMGGTDGDAVSGDPVILNLSTNITQMDPSTTLIVTAVVTHPQGIAQIVGGTLSDPPAGGTYGAFQVSTTAGSYSLMLTWTQIEAVRDITTPAGGAARSFRAQFYDQSGRTTTQDFSVTMWCGDATSAACAGTCQALASDKFNCGACGRSCQAFAGSTVATTPSCNGGKCSNVTIDLSSTTAESCQSVCGADGMVCQGNSFNAFFKCSGTVPVNCTTLPIPSSICTSDTFQSIRCLCME
jgi:hypothetical protein